MLTPPPTPAAHQRNLQISLQFSSCVDFLANTPTTNHYANTDEVPTMLAKRRRKKKRNLSEATATYNVRSKLPFTLSNNCAN